VDKNTKTVIYRSVGIVIALILLALIAHFAINKLQQRVNDAKNNPNIVYVEPPKTPISDTEYAKMISDAILSYYKVHEFPEILYQDPENLLGQTQSIAPSTPGSNDGEYTIKFIAEHELGTWSSAQAQSAAIEAMKIVGPQIPEVTGITAEISVWLSGSPDKKGSKPYATFRAGRDVLGS
jgi:hypothetical protein